MRPNKPDFRCVFTAVKWVRLIFLRDFCSKSYMSYSMLISDSLCSLTEYVYVTLHGNKVVRGLGMVIREPLYCGVYFQKSVHSGEQVWGIGQLCGMSQLPVMTIRTWHSTDCGEMVTVSGSSWSHQAIPRLTRMHSAMRSGSALELGYCWRANSNTVLPQ